MSPANPGDISIVRSADEVNRLAEQAVGALEAELPVAAAFLFGSYVEGGAHEGSDIDLAVFVEDTTRLKFAEKSRLQLYLQRHCALDLELHLYPADALQRARRTNFTVICSTMAGGYGRTSRVPTERATKLSAQAQK